MTPPWEEDRGSLYMEKVAVEERMESSGVEGRMESSGVEERRAMLAVDAHRAIPALEALPEETLIGSRTSYLAAFGVFPIHHTRQERSAC